MRKRLLVAGAAVVLALGLGAGVAVAQADPTDEIPSTEAPEQGGTGGMQGVDMDAMHAQMRDQMPEEMRAQCDEIHANGMGAMMGGGMGGGMGEGMGGGMMGGSR